MAKASIPTRDVQIDKVNNCDSVDLVVIGGGIHGATVAELAVKQGLTVALFEKSDFASGTSSRSTKLAHGGLRYLEMGDLTQVFEGIKAREKLFCDFPNIVKPCNFLIPIPKGDWFQRIQLGAGLFLYDLMVKRKERKHSWVGPEIAKSHGFHGELMGAYQYTDGILNDARLVIERLIRARSAGAVTLNYAEAKEISADGTVSWADKVSGNEHILKTKSVINCAGPWAPYLKGATRYAKEQSPVRYSRGSHLVFSYRWERPALFLPMKGKARYYFILPHFAGTLVGTTEREVVDLEDDPMPSADEIEEIMVRLKRDLPSGELNRDNLHYCFAGIRTLPLRKGHRDVTRLSRKHIWEWEGGVLTLLGGKYTTAEWTAEEGVKHVLQRLGRTWTALEKSERGDLDRWSKGALDSGLTPEETASILGKYGYRVVEIFKTFERMDHGLLKEEVQNAIETEQAIRLEDILRRRLCQEFMPGNGLEMLDVIGAMLEERHPKLNIDIEKTAYRARIARMKELLKYA